MFRKRRLFLVTAAFVLLSALPALACDSSCPINHRKGHLTPWEVLVEKSFGIPGGFGKALMTEEEWAEQKIEMAGMTTLERQEHKMKMNFILLGRAGELGITIPAIGKKREFNQEKTLPFVYGNAGNNLR